MKWNTIINKGRVLAHTRRKREKLIHFKKRKRKVIYLQDQRCMFLPSKYSADQHNRTIGNSRHDRNIFAETKPQLIYCWFMGNCPQIKPKNISYRWVEFPMGTFQSVFFQMSVRSWLVTSPVAQNNISSWRRERTFTGSARPLVSFWTSPMSLLRTLWFPCLMAWTCKKAPDKWTIFFLKHY